MDPENRGSRQAAAAALKAAAADLAGKGNTSAILSDSFLDDLLVAVWRYQFDEDDRQVKVALRDLVRAALDRQTEGGSDAP